MSELIGFSNRIIDIRTDFNNNKEIAFFYPGMRYGSDAPLFYYLIRLLRSKNIDICFFEFEWNKLPLDETVTREEKISVIKSEILTS